MNMLHHGDRLDIAKEVSDGSVDLGSFLHDAHETDAVIGEGAHNNRIAELPKTRGTGEHLALNT